MWLLITSYHFLLISLFYYLFKRLRQQKIMANMCGGRGRSCRPCSAGPIYWFSRGTKNRRCFEVHYRALHIENSIAGVRVGFLVVSSVGPSSERKMHGPVRCGFFLTNGLLVHSRRLTLLSTSEVQQSEFICAKYMFCFSACLNTLIGIPIT